MHEMSQAAGDQKDYQTEAGSRIGRKAAGREDTYEPFVGYTYAEGGHDARNEVNICVRARS